MYVIYIYIRYIYKCFFIYFYLANYIYKCILFFSIWLISFLEKGLALHLNKLEIPLLRDNLYLKFGLNCPSNSPDALKVLGKGHGPSFAKTESHLTKDAHGEDNC